ncbi:response regulator transcription factor [Schinkia azotoformans]|uniref:response regulator transcription factor n=1 Tax=Schinkia azotoformans TaxID=1454 RepID=UPI002DBE19C3|nr:response regulator transcription factor [Schinkia azotoformans]MEC1716294.1 response regulator transcription factor [Schinkia azotoformans]MEC1741671.1 response regulator transcription factor [Schinkia azotoformans]MEC1745693.1 response regulator transcription factor [Schinkia azotoformans]MEC1758937.1 response regulator transcription factor [Schinkia azotoformans]MEC1766891.1 response regulator transcription factor [Schinkia azotoformans]
MNPIKVLVIEDDASIVEILRLYLQREGFTVYTSLKAADGIRLMEEVTPHIVLLDIHLPDKSGFELARKYREISNGILIFITGEKTKTTIIQGFDIGCDDYVTKPFDPPELIARIKAQLRRSGMATAKILRVGDLTINFTNKSVYKNNEKIDLFIKERMLLFYLAEHPNQVFSTEQLYDNIWGIDYNTDLKTVSVHISTLRKKIEDNPKKPRYIETVRGFGYKFPL